ncbi:diguanylate cyclase [Clostridium niameyense]|uniref:Diguanylate cyclase n=1 Tax=Clostridium niameyense TaxID=1622073 RepID=A0A6M0RBY7_9CLOT|nr:NifB/NifX family molybdenum-iron cluster-binding protein [Clostridium niameyense]NEZ46698.1 diguanylate cyclase [Clostridium niameyense]
MKIAISSKGKSMEDLLDLRFGRCEYFQIHDMDNDELKVVKNEGAMSGGGAGIVAAQQLIDEKVDVIITGKLGPNAFKLVDAANIKAYSCEGISIKSVLEKYKNKELSKLDTAGPEHNGMGNGFKGGR